MDLNSIWMFLKVTQTGSFTQAAKELGVPKSTISKKVADLETSLQTTLLKRTTRSLTLTEVGKEYYKSCAKALDDLKAAEANTQALSSEPVGHLRVTAPSEFAQSAQGEIMNGFLKAYPKVTLELILTNQAMDLVRDNIDVAIRAGALKDSNLKARKIGNNRFQLFASPGYLKKAAPIKTPADLAKHSCLIFTALEDSGTWALKSGTKVAKIKIFGPYQANSISAIKSMAIAGGGVALLPCSSCRTELEKNQLSVILPEWSSGDASVHLVYQNSPFIAPKVTAFLNHVQDPLSRLME